MTLQATGSVSAQAQAGETVTIIVTRPSGGADTLTASTLADLSYSATYIPTEVGNHTATAHIDADSQFSSADASATFTVAPTARTITLSVA